MNPSQLQAQVALSGSEQAVVYSAVRVMKSCVTQCETLHLLHAGKTETVDACEMTEL
jgi:hypothetical protein